MSVPMPISSATRFNAIASSVRPSVSVLRQPSLDEQRLHLDEVFLGEGAVLGRTLVPRRLDVGVEKRIDPRIGHRPLEGEMDRLDDVGWEVLRSYQAVRALADHVDAALAER